MFLCCSGKGEGGLAEGRVQELRLFEFEGGPLIQVEVNLEEAPLFMFKRRDRREESTEVRNIVLKGFVNLKRSESEVIAVVRFPRRNCALSTAACQTTHLAPRLEAACHLLTVVLRF